MPERETPGIRATACASPTNNALNGPNRDTRAGRMPQSSAATSTALNRISIVATQTGSRIFSSTVSSKKKPRMPAGIVPMTISQASRESSLKSQRRRPMLAKPATTSRTTVSQK